MAETQTSEADIGLIQRIIPHRYPFLLIDKVRDIVPHKSGVGIKNVTFNEPHFQGHFPNKPVMPGVTIVEAMAQTAAVVVGALMPALASPDALARMLQLILGTLGGVGVAACCCGCGFG